MAQFEKGNKLAKGGARPGSGPKGLTKKQIQEAASQIRVMVDMSDGEGPKGVQLGLACYVVAARIMTGDFSIGAPVNAVTGVKVDDPDVLERASIQLTAAFKLLDRLQGRPAIAIELGGAVGVDLRAIITDARRTKEIVSTISDMAPALPSSARGASTSISQGPVAVPRNRGGGGKGSGGKPRPKGKPPRKGGG